MVWSQYVAQDVWQLLGLVAGTMAFFRSMYIVVGAIIDCIEKKMGDKKEKKRQSKYELLKEDYD
jgi:hypothetical protein